MSEITIKGFVNKPKSLESSKGRYSRFTVAERQKVKGRNGAPDTFEKVYFDVIDFDSPNPPEESSLVTLKGYLTINKWEKDGKHGFNFNVVSKGYEVAPPRESFGTPAATGLPPEDPFDLNK